MVQLLTGPWCLVCFFDIHLWDPIFKTTLCQVRIEEYKGKIPSVGEPKTGSLGEDTENQQEEDRYFSQGGSFHNPSKSAEMVQRVGKFNP